ncbi:hypothetical protein ES703_76140 [subsurface metagenome]
MGEYKVGRNDPCPCGSGKKYKNCCYLNKIRAWKTAGSHESPAFTVKPKETPEPITHHLSSSNGGKTSESRPRLLAAQTIGKKLEDIDEKINKVKESAMFDINTLNLSGVTKQKFEECINDIDHKLYAVKYHLNNYKQAESEKIKEFSKNYKPPAGVQMMIEEPRLIYEVEAFLFQTKSCLDMVSKVIEPVFDFEDCSFGKMGDQLIKQLRNKCPPLLTTCAEKIIKLIENAQEAWIVELIEMRNIITHRSKLQGFNCFMRDPYMGGDIAAIHYPTMPNKRRALEYCQDVYEKLLSFCEEFLKLTLEAARKCNIDMR